MNAETWLNAVAADFPPGVASRIRAEYSAHLEGLRGSGLAEPEALAQLGNARAINRKLMWNYMTRAELKWHRNPVEWWAPLVVGTVGLFTTYLVVWEGSDPLLLVGGTGVLLLIGFGWWFTRNFDTPRRGLWRNAAGLLGLLGYTLLWGVHGLEFASELGMLVHVFWLNVVSVLGMVALVWLNNIRLRRTLALERAT